MKLSFALIAALFALPVFADDQCNGFTRTANGNITMICEDIGNLVPGPNGTQVFATRRAYALPQEGRIEGIMLEAQDGERTFSAGPYQLNPGVRLADLVGLSGEALLARVNVAGNYRLPARIPASAYRNGNLLIPEAALQDSESGLSQAASTAAVVPPPPAAAAPNCTYVQSENRMVNLTRFQPSGGRCQDTGCLPREIFICLATIVCEGSAPYQTTCKSSPSGCPSVRECVDDDSVTTAAERENIERLRAARPAGTEG